MFEVIAKNMIKYIFLISLILFGCKKDPINPDIAKKLSLSIAKTNCTELYWYGYSKCGWIVRGCQMYFECNNDKCWKRQDLVNADSDIDMLMLMIVVSS